MQSNLPLAELKHSVLLHMQVAGGLTDSIAKISLKLIDALEDTDQYRIDKEVMAMSCVLMKELYESTIQVYNGLDNIDPIDDWVINSECEDKGQYLLSLARIFEVLNKHSGVKYPVITNSVGEII
jgi:hypothetical protein